MECSLDWITTILPLFLARYWDPDHFTLKLMKLEILKNEIINIASNNRIIELRIQNCNRTRNDLLYTKTCNKSIYYPFFDYKITFVKSNKRHKLKKLFFSQNLILNSFKDFCYTILIFGNTNSINTHLRPK